MNQTTELVPYYVTFGNKYTTERGSRHPQAPSIHGGGYVVIKAPDYETARRMAFGAFGPKWAFLYEDRPSGEHLGTIVINFPLLEWDATTEYHVEETTGEKETE
jgi:hypothetical protein